MEIYLRDSKATLALGSTLGELFTKVLPELNNVVLCLNGQLGTGKTLLSQGLAAAMGVDSALVTSPSFTLMNLYQGSAWELRHFDFYRLKRADELEDIGFEEYANRPGVTVIEWAELFAASLPATYLEVRLAAAGAGRRVEILAHGEVYEQFPASLLQTFI